MSPSARWTEASGGPQPGSVCTIAMVVGGTVDTGAGFEASDVPQPKPVAVTPPRAQTNPITNSARLRHPSSRCVAPRASPAVASIGQAAAPLPRERQEMLRDGESHLKEERHTGMTSGGGALGSRAGRG